MASEPLLDAQRTDGRALPHAASGAAAPPTPPPRRPPPPAASPRRRSPALCSPSRPSARCHRTARSRRATCGTRWRARAIGSSPVASTFAGSASRGGTARRPAGERGGGGAPRADAGCRCGPGLWAAALAGDAFLCVFRASPRASTAAAAAAAAALSARRWATLALSPRPGGQRARGGGRLGARPAGGGGGGGGGDYGAPRLGALVRLEGADPISLRRYPHRRKGGGFGNFVDDARGGRRRRRRRPPPAARPVTAAARVAVSETHALVLCRSGRVVSAAMPRSTTAEPDTPPLGRRATGGGGAASAFALALALAGEPRASAVAAGGRFFVVLAEGRRRGELYWGSGGRPAPGHAQCELPATSAQPFGRWAHRFRRDTFLRASASGAHASRSPTAAHCSRGATASSSPCAWACSSPRPSRRSPRASPSASSCRRPTTCARRRRRRKRRRCSRRLRRSHGRCSRAAATSGLRSCSPPAPTPSPYAARRQPLVCSHAVLVGRRTAPRVPARPRGRLRRVAATRRAARRRRRAALLPAAPSSAAAAASTASADCSPATRASSCRARCATAPAHGAAAPVVELPDPRAFAAAMGDGAAARVAAVPQASLLLQWDTLDASSVGLADGGADGIVARRERLTCRPSPRVQPAPSSYSSATPPAGRPRPRRCARCGAFERCADGARRRAPPPRTTTPSSAARTRCGYGSSSARCRRRSSCARTERPPRAAALREALASCARRPRARLRAAAAEPALLPPAPRPTGAPPWLAGFFEEFNEELVHLLDGDERFRF